MMAKAQRNYEEQQYDKDVTRHDQQTEVSLRQQETKLPLASIALFICVCMHAYWFMHSFMHSCIDSVACWGVSSFILLVLHLCYR